MCLQSDGAVNCVKMGCLMMKRCSYIVVLMTILLIFTGCVRTAPDMNETQRIFQENYEDIQTVVTELLNMDFQDIFFERDRKNGIVMWADFEDRKIKNPTLAQAVKALLSNGKYENISKKDGEMIIFEQPITYYGRSSGIVYTLSTTKVPNVEYAIKIKPLPESGWYYFVSDPDQWRVEQTKSA